jgi:hypothetical protein
VYHPRTDWAKSNGPAHTRSMRLPITTATCVVCLDCGKEYTGGHSICEDFNSCQYSNWPFIRYRTCLRLTLAISPVSLLNDAAKK